MSLNIVRADTGLGLARWRTHVLVTYRRSATDVEAAQICDATLAAVRTAPGKAVHVAWVRSGAGVPDSGARAEYIRLGRGSAGKLAGMLAIVEGEGFRGSVLRSFITGVALAARIDFPLKLVATPSEGAQWARTELGMDAPALIAALEELDAQAGKTVP